MKKLLSLFVSMLATSQMVSAQHDLYNWQLRAYAGVANYYNTQNSASDYFKIYDNLLYRLELGHSLGNTFGLSVGAAYGSVRGWDEMAGNRFSTDTRMASLRLYFYTDNGWMFSTTAPIAPYFYGGYGFSHLETTYYGATEENRYKPVVPFGLGIKFRLSDRWQLDLHTEAVYSFDAPLETLVLPQNEYNNTFLHTGVALAYSFGFRKSEFVAPRFYAGESRAAPAAGTFRGTAQRQPGVVQELQQRQVMLDTTSAIDSLTRVARTQTPDQVSVDSLRRLSEPAYSQNPDYSQDTVLAAGTLRARQQLREENLRRNSLVPMQDTVIRVMTGADTVYQVYRQEPQRIERVYVDEPRRVETIYRDDPRYYDRDYYDRNYNNRERIVYVPEEGGDRRNRRTTVVAPSFTDAQLEDDRRRLAQANATNRQLRTTLDSLQALNLANQALQPDTAAGRMNEQVLRYMEQQAALNDSLLHTLDLYAVEMGQLRLAQNPPAAAAPESAAGMGAVYTNVFYELNSDKATPESFNDLMRLAAYLKAQPAASVQITGFTDQTGDAAYNKTLSRRRAEAVADLLQSQGVPQERILLQYFGETKSNRSVNPLDRRVELRIIE